MIYPISPAELQDDFLRTRIYPDLEQTFYWSDSWEPTFYVALARAGFISISHFHPEHGHLLFPELQKSYAVLDWERLHISRHLRKIMRSGRLESEGIELRIAESCERVVERILDYHGPQTWLCEPYRALLSNLESSKDGAFALRGIELWSRDREEIVAGELGYTIGRSYTSLSGFCNRDEARWRHFGTLQMVLLAEQLRDSGYAFWNLGHPRMPYKRALGARVLQRKTFLKRWLEARDQDPLRPL